MDVAITGSSGLIGTALCRALEADGHRVRRIVRHSPAEGEVWWDPETGRMDAHGLEGIDAAVHLAGEPIAKGRWNDKRKAAIRDSRVRGTTLLATTLASLADGPTALLSGSAIGYYGERGDQVLTEASPAGQGFFPDVCVAWEEAAAPARDAGIRVAHLRTGIVLDGHGGALAPMLPLFRFGVGGRMGSGRQYWSWITLADHLAAVRFVLENDISGPVNLTAPEPATNAAFTKALAGALHRPALVPTPAFGPRLVLGRELADEVVFTSTRVVPAVLTEAGFTFTQPHLDGALAAVLG